MRVEETLRLFDFSYIQIIYNARGDGFLVRLCGDGTSSDFPDVIKGQAEYFALK